MPTENSTPVRHTLSAAVANYEDAIVAFTKDLIAIPSENPPGAAYRACADRIAEELAKCDLEATLFEAPPIPRDADTSALQPGCCLISSYGEGTPTLYFHGHYDVVPAVSQEQFQPQLHEGMLIGRGSSDMKGGIAAMIYAVRALKELHIRLNGQVALTLVPDEETGGDRGSRYLALSGLLGRDGIGMLTAEPTQGAIWNASRGAISMTVTVRGKPAHVGLHYQGVNAFEQMLRVTDALLELKQEIIARRTDFHIDPEAAHSSILLMGGRSQGGSNFNLVPATCSFTVDRRINPEEDLTIEKARLLEIFDRVRDEGIELDVDIFQEAPSSGADWQHPIAQKLAHNVAHITGTMPTFELCPGLLETRWYATQSIPAFAYGPGLLSVSHGPDEYVPVTHLTQAATIYALTAYDVLGSTAL